MDAPNAKQPMTPEEFAATMAKIFNRFWCRERRERIATAAMAGILASVDMTRPMQMLASTKIVEAAVEFADALIAELEKKP
jgi:hypothetical protein